VNNPCISCGVCCKTYRIAFHWSECGDNQNQVPFELTQSWRRHEVIMLGTEGPDVHCIALKEHQNGSTECSIHGRHPSVCRDVNIGSDQCQRARVKHGLNILLTS